MNINLPLQPQQETMTITFPAFTTTSKKYSIDLTSKQLAWFDNHPGELDIMFTIIRKTSYAYTFIQKICNYGLSNCLAQVTKTKEVDNYTINFVTNYLSDATKPLNLFARYNKSAKTSTKWTLNLALDANPETTTLPTIISFTIKQTA